MRRADCAGAAAGKTTLTLPMMSTRMPYDSVRVVLVDPKTGDLLRIVDATARRSLPA
jgi:hypothetical protein